MDIYVVRAFFYSAIKVAIILAKNHAPLRVATSTVNPPTLPLYAHVYKTIPSGGDFSTAAQIIL